MTSIDDNSKIEQQVRKVTTQARISGTLYDYLDNLNSRKEDMELIDSPENEQLEMNKRIDKTKNVIAVFESFKGWDYDTLFQRMENESFSIEEDDRDRFDVTATALGRNNSQNESFFPTKQELKQIVNLIWDLAKEATDHDEKREFITLAKELKEHKGNNLHVLTDSLSSQETMLFSLQIDGEVVNETKLSALTQVNQVTSTVNLKEYKYQIYEDKEWDRIKDSNEINGRNLADYKHEDQVVSIEHVSETVLPELIEEKSNDSEYKGNISNFVSGIDLVINNLKQYNDKDMQSIFDKIEASAYRLKDDDKRNGALTAIEQASEHIVDVSLKKTKALLTDISDNLKEELPPGPEREKVEGMLDNFKGNDLKTLMNKLGAIAISFHDNLMDQDSLKDLKKSAGFAFEALQKHDFKVSRTFDAMENTSLSP